MHKLGWFEVLNGRRRNRFSIHSFRRFYISHVKERLGLEVASESVGHASLEQTRDYCRPVVDNPDRRKAVEELAVVFGPPLALPSPNTTNRTT